jgi:nicotinamidase-related amidase
MAAPPTLNLQSAALLLIDLQRDFVHPDGVLASFYGLGPDDTSMLLANCRHLVEMLHAAERPVVYVTTAFRPDYADCALPTHWLAQAMQAAPPGIAATAGLAAMPASIAVPALVEGTWGAGLVDGLTPEPRDYVVVKKGQAAFQHTILDRLLMNLGVTQCLIAGGAVTGALSSTVRQGAALGYEQYVVTDAVYPLRPTDLATLRNRVAYLTTPDVVDADVAALPAAVEPPGYALIVVDIQNDFVQPDGAMHRYGHSGMSDGERARIIANNESLAAAMRARGWPVIYVRDVQSWHGRDTVLGPMMRRAIPMPAEANFIKEGTWGAEFVDGLGRQGSDIEIVKRGNSAFGFTPLHRTLRNLRVRRCLVTGGAVIGCLSDTVREGAGLGYDLTIVSDAVYPPADPYLEVLGELSELRPTAAVLAELERTPASSLAPW